MKKLKILLVVLACVSIVLGTAITFTIGWRPFLGPKMRPTSNRRFETTPERLARGRYLTQGLLGCEGCHTPLNWAAHGAPMVPGMEMAGQVFALPGLPGTLVVSNVTPDRETGAGNWSDDQIARAIREGIGHDDRTIFPIMPYTFYKKMSDEDVASVVIYLRSLPAVRNPLPATQIKFPVNYLVRGVPEPVTQPVPSPANGDLLARGKYLAELGCGCHSPVKNPEYGGGEYLSGPWGTVTSANITPDASGIGYYDEATFIKAVRLGYVGARELNPIMPYGQFQILTDDDLKAMFAYLRSVKPVKHRVDNTLPPTYCKICKQKHGAGDQN